eukprot:7708564-Pyramimonas_sp.AAC.1
MLGGYPRAHRASATRAHASRKSMKVRNWPFGSSSDTLLSIAVTAHLPPDEGRARLDVRGVRTDGREVRTDGRG